MDQDGAATIAPRLRHREHKWANLIKIAEDIDKRYTEGRSLPKTVEETLLFAKRVAEFPAEFPKNFGLGKKSTVMTRTPDIFGSSSRGSLSNGRGAIRPVTYGTLGPSSRCER